MNKLILEGTIVFLIAIFPDVFFSIASLRNRNTNKNEPNLSGLIWGFVYRIVVILLIIYMTLDQRDGLSAVGLDLVNINFLFLFAGGFGLYSAYLLVYTWSYQAIFNKQFDSTSRYQINIARYQTALERVFFVGGILLGVISEELIYRGYLVIYLGEQTGILWPWVVLTILLWIIIHLYQGAESAKIYAHFLFAVIVVTITIFTASIWLAIFTHLFLNVFFLLKSYDRQKAGAEPIKANLNDKPLSLVTRFAFLGIAGSLCAIIGGGFFLFSGAVARMSPVYRQAIQEIETNPQITTLFGEPVEIHTRQTAWDFNEENELEIKLVISIEGSKESGVFHVEANGLEKEWVFTKFVVTTDQQAEINLLDTVSQ